LPVAPLGALWWVFPAAVRVAVGCMFVGGQILGEAFRGEQTLVHPELREKRVPKHRLTAEELAVAETYDAQWQAEDRERNRERALQERHRHAEPESDGFELSG
jgi:hypothetical protein